MPETSQIIAYAASKKILLNKDAVELLRGREDWSSILDSFAENKVFSVDGPTLTKELMERISKSKTASKTQETTTVIRETKFKPFAKEISSQLNLREELEASHDSQSRGEMSDFISYFNDNFSKRKNIIESSRGIKGLEMYKLKNTPPRQEVNVVGMVYEKYETKNGHYIITVEDPTGKAKILILKDRSDLINLAQDVIEDDVILINGFRGKDFNTTSRFQEPMVVAEKIQFPEIPMKPKNTISEDIALASTSDIHIGHKKFLETPFKKFISWLQGDLGNEKQRQLAGKIKYLTLVGDCVDGVGVYPGQEEELLIQDIYKQYAELEKYLEQIPDYIEILITPGNHDAARVADPVPKLDHKKYLPNATHMENVHFLGSPGRAEVHGVKLLLYHGESMHNLWSLMPHKLTAEQPEKAMIEYLRKRHLAPYYGETSNSKGYIFPEREDILTINEVPDIFITGHVHRNGYAEYRGSLAINDGCWQTQTEFQAKQGHLPTPGIVPVVSLKDYKINEMKFA